MQRTSSTVFGFRDSDFL